MRACYRRNIGHRWNLRVDGVIGRERGLTPFRFETLKAWQEGDTQALAGMLKKTFAGNRDLYAFLVTDRNKAWEKTLTHTLDKDGKLVFVAVGAGHLVGKGNLILGLEKAGFKVTQM